MLRVFAVIFALLAGAAPALASDLSIVVDLSRQTMVVSVDGNPQYQWDVSTGKKGYRTPTGHYGPVRMYREYYSQKYDNAPMPYSIFFHGGYAIHGTSHQRALGSPASHGCVRLSTAHASVLYDLVKSLGADHTRIRIKS